MDTLHSLRVVYMGTPQFAVAPLQLLLKAGVNVVSVVTSPDKPAGRGRQISQSQVKQFAVEYNLPVLQPTNLKDEEFIADLKRLQADLFVVVAFRMLPKIVWSIPKYGTFNLHASLLPQYRGAAPINWAIVNGEKTTGVTTFFIDEQIDTGRVIHQQEVAIEPNDSAGLLHDKLMALGAELVVKTVIGLGTGELNATSQDELIKDQVLQPAPKLSRENTRIQWTNSASRLHDFIRGFSPYPAAWTELVDKDGKAIQAKILEAEVSEATHNDLPGTIHANEPTITVSCGEGSINILRLQVSGKKAMTTEDFLRGFRDLQNYSFK